MKLTLINATDATDRKRTKPGALVAMLQACVWQDDGSMFTLLGYASIVNRGESPTMVQYSRSLCSSPLTVLLPRRLYPGAERRVSG